MSKNSTLRFFAFVLLSLVPQVCGLAASAGTKPDSEPGRTEVEPRWLKRLSFNDRSDESPVAIRAADGGYFVVAGSGPSGAQPKYDLAIVIWKLDITGSEQWVKGLGLPDLAENRELTGGQFLGLSSEPVLIVGRSPGMEFRLVRFDHNGLVTASQRLDFGVGLFVLKDFEKTEGGFLVCGSDVSKQEDAWVAKIDLNGKLVWDKRYDNGKSEQATATAAGSDGGFALAANSGTYDKFGGGPSDVWVIRCDSRGNILEQTTFKGRNAHLTVTAEGAAVVVYNKADFPRQQISVVELDSKLNAVWKIEDLFGNTQGLGAFKIINDPRGGVVLAGSRFFAAGLWKIDRSGRVLWSYDIKGAELCVTFDSLIATGRGYLVAGGTPAETKMLHSGDDSATEEKDADISDVLVAEVSAPALEGVLRAAVAQ